MGVCVCVFPHPCSERIMSIKNPWTPLCNNIDKIFHNTYTKSHTHKLTNKYKCLHTCVQNYQYSHHCSFIYSSSISVIQTKNLKPTTPLSAPTSMTSSTSTSTKTSNATTMTTTVPKRGLRPPSVIATRVKQHVEASTKPSEIVVRPESTTKEATTSAEQMPKPTSKVPKMRTALATMPKAMSQSNDSHENPKGQPVKMKTQPSNTVSTVAQVPAEAQISVTSPTQKPSLLPKPKVKVVIPPALLHKHQSHPQHETGQELEEELTSPPSSRIPVLRTSANAEKRALQATMEISSSAGSSHDSSTSLKDANKSNSFIK